jgi:hypothetical protein
MLVGLRKKIKICRRGEEKDAKLPEVTLVESTDEVKVVTEEVKVRLKRSYKEARRVEDRQVCRGRKDSR